jgi:HAD superfamily hydrolase (TIGR01509 family)
VRCNSWDKLEALLVDSGCDAVAWDFDGVLYDSTPLFHQVLLSECIAFHLVDADATASLNALLGRDTLDLLEHLLPDHERANAASLRDRIVSKYETAAAGQLQIDVAAGRVVERLGRAGVRQCVVSNGRRAFVETELRRSDLQDLISPVITPTNGLRPKPAPDLYLCATSALDCRNCVAVEDSDAGIAAALAAGLTVIRTELYGR